MPLNIPDFFGRCQVWNKYFAVTFLQWISSEKITLSIQFHLNPRCKLQHCLRLNLLKSFNKETSFLNLSPGQWCDSNIDVSVVHTCAFFISRSKNNNETNTEHQTFETLSWERVIVFVRTQTSERPSSLVCVYVLLSLYPADILLLFFLSQP